MNEPMQPNPDRFKKVVEGYARHRKVKPQAKGFRPEKFQASEPSGTNTTVPQPNLKKPPQQYGLGGAEIPDKNPVGEGFAGI